MSRWKAASVHFGLSAAIAAALIGMMLALWYPPPYFVLMGGAMLVILIAGCDVVLGPLVTLIIFRSGKKGLALDLAIIGCVQALALGYGLYTMFEARPAFTVFAVDRFEVVAANDIRTEELARAPAQFASLPLTGPRVVGAVQPADPYERVTIAIAAAMGGEDIRHYPRLYVAYDSLARDAARHARPLAVLEKRNPDKSRDLVEALNRIGAQRDAVGYLPIIGRFHSMSAIVNKQSGRIEGFVDAQPW